MLNHFVQGDRKCGRIARHHIGSRIPYKDNINTGTLKYLRKREVICCKHGDLFSLDFHFLQHMGRHFGDISSEFEYKGITIKFVYHFVVYYNYILEFIYLCRTIIISLSK